MNVRKSAQCKSCRFQPTWVESGNLYLAFFAFRQTMPNLWLHIDFVLCGRISLPFRRHSVDLLMNSPAPDCPQFEMASCWVR